MTDVLEVFCDGSITGSHWAKRNQRDTLAHGWCGWWVRHQGAHVPLYWESLDLGEGTHMSANVSEYMAVRSALRWIADSPWKHAVVKIHSDSQVVIKQLTGDCNTYDLKLMFLRDQCLKLAKLLTYVGYKWIPRQDNKEADVLSKGHQIWQRRPTWQEVLGYLIKKPSGRVKKSAPPAADQAPKASE
jgi:ribonuclease HI